jgi:hemoglobin
MDVRRLREGKFGAPEDAFVERPIVYRRTVDAMYDRVGGQDFFTALVDRFYAGVAMDLVLRPLYPDDLDEPKAHLAMFLAQYWGGPPTYGEVRGHPRLRMRHAPFVIGPLERDAWLRHMTEALRAAGLSPEDEAEMLAYFEMAANQLMNAR